MIWAYENASWRWWWGQNDGAEEGIERARSWHLTLDPQLHSRPLPSQTLPVSQTYTTPSKNILDRFRHAHDRFTPSPAPKSSSLAALMSRSEISLVRHPATQEDKQGSLANASNSGGGLSNASLSADLREMKRMMAGLSGLVEELRTRLDQQSDLVRGEGDEG